MNLTRLCAETDVPADQILKIDLPDRPAVAIAASDGGFLVFDDKCPHADESLSKGWVEDGRIVCAVHFAEFEAGTGTAHNAPVGCGALKFYPVTLQDGAIFADLTTSA